MRIAYVDPSNGVTAAMLLGALVDLGLDIKSLKNVLNMLNIEYCLNVYSSGNHTKTDISVNDNVHWRTRDDIFNILNQLDNHIKDVADVVKLIFHKIIKVESIIHKLSADKVHLHEVSCLGNILAVVGVVYGFKMLGVDQVYSTAFSVGSGEIECSHGKVQLPCPATALLTAGYPVHKTEIKYELTTPTGAAILISLCEKIGEKPLGTKVGYGAGKYIDYFPNVVKVSILDK